MKEVTNGQVVKKWLTTEEAAYYLGTTKKAILNLVHKQKLKFYKYGRHNRYLVEDLDALITGYSDNNTDPDGSFTQAV